MKVFIWECVLRDYTEGMAVAVAPDMESALELFEPRIANRLSRPTKVISCEEPEEFGAYVCGGA